jgi:anti-anti-sigma factor
MLEIEPQPGAPATLVVVGELDPATAPILAERLEPLTEDPTVATVALDLAGVTFLDSSGLRTLVAANAVLQARDAALVLRSPSPNIRRVLEVTGLTELIAVE